MSYVGSLLSNIHEGLESPIIHDGKAEETLLVRGVYDYFHYCCDGFDDRGWGCGYRSLQTLCSWILHMRNCEDAQGEVPSIPSIQKLLVAIEDKPPFFENSREWIGSVEVGYVLSNMYNIDFRIIHTNENQTWETVVKILANHFKCGGSPVMMGGKSDVSSKCIIGTHGDSHMLIVDPHFVGKAEHPSQLQALGWVRWQNVNDFSTCMSDFYNLCLPLVNVLS